jgi:putative flavoprotein involved in K+ transport
MADKKIKLIQFSDIEKFNNDGIQLNSENYTFDSFVFATGYKGQEFMVEKLFGKKVASKVGKIWDFDNKKQELNNMFVKTNQKGLWFIAGSLAQCRIFSKYLSYQILDELKN